MESGYEVKQKLTLGISREVIEKAKKEEINISAITEQVLKAMTYEPTGSTKSDIVGAYQKLYEVAGNVLEKYNTRTLAGIEREYDTYDEEEFFENASYPIYLDSHGHLWKYSRPSTGTSVSVEEVFDDLFLPTQFLENLILSLIDAARRNKEKLMELEFALRFVKTLSGVDSESAIKK